MSGGLTIRPYQAGDEDAVQELRDCAETDFDPDVVRAFERAWKKGKIRLDSEVPQASHQEKSPPDPAPKPPGESEMEVSLR